MKNLIVTGALLLWLAACQNKKQLPEGVLPEGKMKALLWDMMRADQFLNDFVFSRDTSLDKQKESIRLYRQVLALHKVSKKDLQQSMSYYLAHQDKFKAILDSVAVRSPSRPSLVPDTAITPVSPGKKDTVAIRRIPQKLQAQ
ncbi:MAG: DUF4296 domain-containing protein [Bacteroidetes bacterium]|nr:DUF4296 domain-containing protein [Bacteroidota bacterium]